MNNDEIQYKITKQENKLTALDELIDELLNKRIELAEDIVRLEALRDE